MFSLFGNELVDTYPYVAISHNLEHAALKTRKETGKDTILQVRLKIENLWRRFSTLVNAFVRLMDRDVFVCVSN